MPSQRRTPAELLKTAKSVAIARGGRCVTRKITSSQDYVTLVCSRGHRWRAHPHDLIGKRQTWCKICSYEARSAALRTDLRTIQEYAEERGGRCLSKTYKNAREKLEFKCARGHRWSASWGNLARGQWCPICRRAEAAESRRLGIEVAQKLARKRGGKCLSTDYVDNRQPLRWQCAKGHEWDARLDRVKGTGSWCPECARLKLSRKRKGRPPPERRKITLADLQAFARKHRGRCLTDFYVNQRQVFDWECKRGHRFRSSWVNTLGRDNFCPECTKLQHKDEMLRRAHRLAKVARGRCLSHAYEDARAPMKWQCKKGHLFSDTWVNISTRESFCPRCR